MVAEERSDLASALSWAAQAWQLAATHNLPVIAQSRIHLARIRDKHGPAQFAEWWRDFTGEEPPGIWTRRMMGRFCSRGADLAA